MPSSDQGLFSCGFCYRVVYVRGELIRYCTQPPPLIVLRQASKPVSTAHAFSISCERTRHPLNKLKNRIGRRNPGSYLAHAIKFNNDFWTCVERVPAVAIAGSPSYFSQRSGFLRVNQMYGWHWEQDFQASLAFCKNPAWLHRPTTGIV